jgi:hypothetical protein
MNWLLILFFILVIGLIIYILQTSDNYIPYIYSIMFNNNAINIIVDEPKNKQKRRDMNDKKLINKLQRPKEKRIPAPNCEDSEFEPIHAPSNKPEVFQINNNHFTYTEALPVCMSYGAKLATKSQIQSAYNDGANWCNYGWVEGGEAYMLTQQDEFNKLQNSQIESTRTKCGPSAGVHGGPFPETRRFGVYCYGRKPALWNECKGCASQLPFTPEELKMRDEARYHKSKHDNYVISSWNTKNWARTY